MEKTAGEIIRAIIYLILIWWAYEKGREDGKRSCEG